MDADALVIWQDKPNELDEATAWACLAEAVLFGGIHEEALRQMGFVFRDGFNISHINATKKFLVLRCDGKYYQLIENLEKNLREVVEFAVQT